MATRKKVTRQVKHADVPRTAPYINVGHAREAIEAGSRGVLAIINAPHCDEETKRAALSCFGRVAAVNNLTITGCTFGETVSVREEPMPF